jgi:hypothetical protein
MTPPKFRRTVVAVLSILVLSTMLFGGPGRSGTLFMFSLHTLDFRGDLTRDLTLWHFETSAKSNMRNSTTSIIF